MHAAEWHQMIRARCNFRIRRRPKMNLCSQCMMMPFVPFYLRPSNGGGTTDPGSGVSGPGGLQYKLGSDSQTGFRRTCCGMIFN